MAQIETTHEVGFQLGVGEHKLRFSPKEQYKDELSLRSLTLPVVNLRGSVQRREKTKAPQVKVEVAVKVINIDLTTDVLNQLLIVQNSFIKVSPPLPTSGRLLLPHPPPTAPPTCSPLNHLSVL